MTNRASLGLLNVSGRDPTALRLGIVVAIAHRGGDHHDVPPSGAEIAHLGLHSHEDEAGEELEEQHDHHRPYAIGPLILRVYLDITIRHAVTSRPLKGSREGETKWEEKLERLSDRVRDDTLEAHLDEPSLEVLWRRR